MSMEFTQPTGYVTRVGGLAPTRSLAPEADDMPPGIQYTGGFGRITRVAGGPPHRRQPTQRSSDTYWATRRRVELADQRRANPDGGLYGLAVPYGIVLPLQGDRVTFGADTEWLLRRPDLGLLLQHSGLLGTCRLDETPGGLYAHGTIFAERRHVVADRRELSPKLAVIDAVRRPDGVLQVRRATIDEISVVRSGAWGPHTSCTIWQQASA